MLGQVSAGGAELLAGIGVARWKPWPAVEKCLLKYSIIVDISVVTVFPSVSAVGSWEEVLLFSMDFSLPKPFGISATGCKFLFEKAIRCFPNCLCILVPDFPEKLHIAGTIRCYNAVCHRMFLCWSRAVKSGVNQGLYLFLVLYFLNGAYMVVHTWWC